MTIASSWKLAATPLLALALPLSAAACLDPSDAEDTTGTPTGENEEALVRRVAPGLEHRVRADIHQGSGCSCSGGHCEAGSCGANGCDGCSCGCSRHLPNAGDGSGCSCGGNGHCGGGCSCGCGAHALPTPARP
jgi:hypothetical protein